MRILLLIDRPDDDPAGVRDALVVRGHQVTIGSRELASDVTAAPFASVDLIIADAELAETSQLVPQLAAIAPGIEFVLVGDRRGPMPADVVEQLARPLLIDRLLAVIDEVADILDGEHLSEPIELVAYETVFAGDSPQALALLRRVRLVARSEAPVWVFGDDGSGRGIIARAIHDRSSRRSGPFVAFNTAAHSDDELARVLFLGEHPAVEKAAAGTLFLEQISTAGPNTQRHLVQFLERKRLEDRDTARLIVGVQSAQTAIGVQKLLSTDLYYALKVLEVEIPPLRERARDLELIVSHMLQRLAADAPTPPVSIETMRLLERYSFPGNLLELAHALTHAVVLAHGSPIEPQHLPASIRQHVPPGRELDESADLQSLDTVAKRFERDYLLRVLRSVDGNRGRAAEILGLSRKGLWGKLKTHGISDDDIEQDGSESDTGTHP